ncbi:MAG: hypothetical protein IKK06_07120 [Clostridia bacterium]|nr:hypothetical protein [Clostridia bacterium]
MENFWLQPHYPPDYVKRDHHYVKKQSDVMSLCKTALPFCGFGTMLWRPLLKRKANQGCVAMQNAASAASFCYLGF